MEHTTDGSIAPQLQVHSAQHGRSVSAAERRYLQQGFCCLQADARVCPRHNCCLVAQRGRVHRGGHTPAHPVGQQPAGSNILNGVCANVVGGWGRAQQRTMRST